MIFLANNDTEWWGDNSKLYVSPFVGDKVVKEIYCGSNKIYDNYRIENPSVALYDRKKYPEGYTKTMTVVTRADGLKLIGSIPSLLGNTWRFSAHANGYKSSPTEWTNPTVIKTGSATSITVTTPNGNTVTYNTDPSGFTKIYNLIPGVNTYKLNTESSSHSFEVSGHIRMIKSDCCRNCRDLGGWSTTDGKTTVYGKLYRGARPGGKAKNASAGTYYGYNSVSPTLSDLITTLNISSQIDVGYSSSTLKNTLPGINKEHTKDLDCSGYSGTVVGEVGGGLTDEDNIQALAWILSELVAGRNVYMHCNEGQDRTGTIAMCILGFCDCTEDSILKDYELSSFFVDNKSISDFYVPSENQLEGPANMLYTLWNTYGSGKTTLSEVIKAWFINKWSSFSTYFSSSTYSNLTGEYDCSTALNTIASFKKILTLDTSGTPLKADSLYFNSVNAEYGNRYLSLSSGLTTTTNTNHYNSQEIDIEVSSTKHLYITIPDTVTWSDGFLGVFLNSSGELVSEVYGASFSLVSGYSNIYLYNSDSLPSGASKILFLCISAGGMFTGVKGYVYVDCSSTPVDHNSNPLQSSGREEEKEEEKEEGEVTDWSVSYSYLDVEPLSTKSVCVATPVITGIDPSELTVTMASDGYTFTLKTGYEQVLYSGSYLYDLYNVGTSTYPKGSVVSSTSAYKSFSSEVAFTDSDGNTKTAQFYLGVPKPSGTYSELKCITIKAGDLYAVFYNNDGGLRTQRHVYVFDESVVQAMQDKKVYVETFKTNIGIYAWQNYTVTNGYMSGAARSSVFSVTTACDPVSGNDCYCKLMVTGGDTPEISAVLVFQTADLGSSSESKYLFDIDNKTASRTLKAAIRDEYKALGWDENTVIAKIYY